MAIQKIAPRKGPEFAQADPADEVLAGVDPVAVMEPDEFIQQTQSQEVGGCLKEYPQILGRFE